MADRKGHDGKGKHHHGKGKNDGPSKDKLENFAINYGWSKAFMDSFPELKKLLAEAVKHTWSPAKFRAELMDTNWYKHHADTARKWLYLTKTDPQTAEQRLLHQGNDILDMAGSFGIEIGEKQAKKWAQLALMHGWDETEVRNHLASMVNIMGKHTVGGELATTLDSLKQKAYMNGVQLSKPTLQRWLRSIVRGDGTQEEYEQYIQNMAVKRFPNWAQEINAGLDMMQIADPYRQSMAELLEINPNQIDLNSKLLKRALSHKVPDNNDKGKEPQYRAMDMTDFEDAVRHDPRWMQTDNAKQTMLDMGSNLLQMFGFYGGSS